MKSTFYEITPRREVDVAFVKDTGMIFHGRRVLIEEEDGKIGRDSVHIGFFHLLFQNLSTIEEDGRCVITGRQPASGTLREKRNSVLSIPEEEE